jgi:uncharacterized protein
VTVLVDVRARRGSDLAALLALNAANEIETSALTERKLGSMLSAAFYAGTIGAGTMAADAALLIAFDQDADYDSQNFIWFRDRYARFVYVDRIIVGASQRGSGVARVLYKDLFQRARHAGHTLIVCEVNVDPPNHGSDAFHQRLGFAEVGRETIASGKTVRYLTRSL